MNKSLLTNVVAVCVAVIGFLLPSTNPLAIPLRDMGMYAASGAFTNWIAIYMLFEKIPGLYGSGVIPSRFEDFKSGIRKLVMDQFFTRQNVEEFFKESSNESAATPSFDPAPILELVDYDAMFASLQQAVLQSSFGNMLNMFGGAKALEGMRAPFKEKMESEVSRLVSSPKIQSALQKSVQSDEVIDSVMSKVDSIVNKRLDELTPQMVKEIIQNMIREHLGWLVVWGGVFGGLIGLIISFLPR